MGAYFFIRTLKKYYLKILTPGGVCLRGSVRYDELFPQPSVRMVSSSRMKVFFMGSI